MTNKDQVVEWVSISTSTLERRWNSGLRTTEETELDQTPAPAEGARLPLMCAFAVLCPYLVLVYTQTYIRGSLCEPLALLLSTTPLRMFAWPDSDFQLSGQTVSMYHLAIVLCALLRGPLPIQDLRFLFR